MGADFKAVNKEEKKEAYAQQRAPIRRLHHDWAARPALFFGGPTPSKAKPWSLRIEVAVSPRPCLGCAVELVLRVAPLRRSNFWPSSAARPPGAINRPQGVAMRHLGCYYMTGPPGTSPLRWRRHWAINAGTSCSSQLCHDCSFGWVLAGLETTDPATGGAAGLETDKGRAGERRGGGGGTTSTTTPEHRLQGQPHVVADPHQSDPESAETVTQ
jgi:hypothetical protein